MVMIAKTTGELAKLLLSYPDDTPLYAEIADSTDEFEEISLVARYPEGDNEDWRLLALLDNVGTFYKEGSS